MFMQTILCQGIVYCPRTYCPVNKSKSNLLSYKNSALSLLDFFFERMSLKILKLRNLFF